MLYIVSSSEKIEYNKTKREKVNKNSFLDMQICISNNNIGKYSHIVCTYVPKSIHKVQRACKPYEDVRCMG